MEVGDREALTPIGAPLTVSATLPLNPPTGATVMTELVPVPGNALTDVGFGVIVKSEVALTVRLIVAV